MGKINVFGSLEEVSKLSKETGCSFCIDFAHVLARYKKIDFENIKKLFPQKVWHCHFSGIEYGEKGEKNHIPTSEKAWKELLENLTEPLQEYKLIREPSPLEKIMKMSSPMFNPK
jgi:deoxyribonuclease-4